MARINKEKIQNGSRLWKCAECGNKGELVPWSYDDLAARGGPVCPSCDTDMILIPKVITDHGHKK